MGLRRVDYLGKKGSHLGSVEAAKEKSAIEQAASQFNITPARRFRIAVTRTRAPEKQEQLERAAALVLRRDLRNEPWARRRYI